MWSRDIGQPESSPARIVLKGDQMEPIEDPVSGKAAFAAVAVVAALVVGLLLTEGHVPTAPAVAEQPKAKPLTHTKAPALCVPAIINEIHDGDTLSVSVDFSMKIRLIDCWAPELKDGVKGQVSKANLIRLTSKNQRCMVEIPLHDDIGKSTSLGRILGRVTVIGQDSDLSTQQVEGGFATRDRD